MYNNLCNRTTHSFPPRCPGHDLTSTGNSLSTLEDGKLKPRIYRVQNVQTETYVDIEIHLRKVCCRRTKTLGEGGGF